MTLFHLVWQKVGLVAINDPEAKEKSQQLLHPNLLNKNDAESNLINFLGEEVKLKKGLQTSRMIWSHCATQR